MSSARRVTERSLRGEVVWQKQLTGWPVGVQRLGNGNTLIVQRNQVLEVNRAGQEVFTFNRPQNDLMTARKVRDGQLVCVTGQGTAVVVDGAGKEVRSNPLPGVSGFGNQVLDTGGVLVPVSWQNKVAEFDRDGKPVVTDGPYAETKEQFGGFHIVECRDADEALAIAARIPTLRVGGTIEVRPVEPRR